MGQHSVWLVHGLQRGGGQVLGCTERVGAHSSKVNALLQQQLLALTAAAAACWGSLPLGQCMGHSEVANR